MGLRETLRLVAVPVALSATVTLLRLAGELLGWSASWFSTETGGMLPSGVSWVVGITWLPIPFGAFFAWRLWRAGERPASPEQVVVLAVLGLAFARYLPALLAGALRPGFPRVLLFVWAAMALAAAVQLRAWPALFRTLLAYGLGSRAIVTVVMALAMLGGWGTHYDYVGMPEPFQMPFWPRFLWLAFFPQLVFWTGFTMVLGALAGGLTVLVLRRSSARLEG